MKLNYKILKKDKVSRVFSLSEYEGVNCFDLDWKQDIVIELGNIRDDYNSIKEFVEDNELFLTLKDAVTFIN